MQTKVSPILFAIFVLFLFQSVLLSCKPNSSNNRNQPTKEEVENVLIDVNILMNEAETQKISDFIERHGWDMSDTGTGLKYMIYVQGSGPEVQSNDIVSINYSVWLLTGELIYSSRDKGVKSFRVGRGGVESGLEEGILLLRVGDRARFIMPSHLAHGFLGDGAKIPKRAAILYDIELVDIK